MKVDLYNARAHMYIQGTLARASARTHAHKHTRTHARTHALTHAHTHTHTHTHTHAQSKHAHISTSSDFQHVMRNGKTPVAAKKSIMNAS